MTPEEETWSKALGALLAVVFLFFVVAGCLLGYRALDDGPAKSPSQWNVNKR
jgi:hypothetical protein